MPNAPKIKYYAFLDVVLDVFYSIILYNAFIAFPGWRLEGFMMAFAVFVMIDYWWAIRSYSAFPKHYLFDFLAITVIMFIFSLWANHFGDIRYFVYVLIAYLIIDTIYSILAIYVHTETSDEKWLKYFAWDEGILAVVYLLLLPFLKVVTPFTLVLLVAPYLISYFISLKSGYIRTKFVESDGELS